MKKSKIIAPAAAILVFSSAAAVTGTVAWFTASRIANFGIESITAVNPEAGLKVTLENINTSASVDNTEDAQKATLQQLRDGSVNLADGKVYRGIPKDNGAQPDSYEEVVSPWKYASQVNTKDVYYASAFLAKFKLSSAAAENYSLFFDANVSTAAITSGTSATSYQVEKALRIGLKTSTGFVAWAPFMTSLNTTAPAKNDTFVSGTATLGNFTASNLNVGNATAATSTLTDETMTTSAAQGLTTAYLGVVNKDGTTTTDVTVYTWFEGTDPNCITGAENIGKTIAASLHFKAIKVQAA